VVEDVVDIILNLKKIKMKAHDSGDIRNHAFRESRGRHHRRYITASNQVDSEP
jgi:DNA-directed RNA polymerase alpha subunit